MDQTTGTGYLIVNVSTARGALPLEGASVTVFYDEDGNSSVHSVLTTDVSGKTERLELPAPSRELSEVPGNAKPYSTYTISAKKDGYYTVTNTGVPIFAGITSVQPIEMIPLAEYDSDNVYPRFGLDTTESEAPQL